MNDRLEIASRALAACLADGEGLNTAVPRAVAAADRLLLELAKTPPPAAVAHPVSPSNGDGAAITSAKDGAARSRAIREKLEGGR